MAAIVVTLEYGTCLHLILQLGNILVFGSFQSYESLHSFDAFKELLGLCHTMFGHHSLIHCFQVTCHSIKYSREFSASIYHLTVLSTFNPHVSLCSFYLVYHIIFLLSFVSIMGDMSWTFLTSLILSTITHHLGIILRN